MEDPPPDRSRWRSPAVRTVLTVLAVAITLVVTRQPSAWLPDLSLPDLPALPDRPGWLWPAFKWTKLAVLVVIGGLALVGALERNRRRDRPDDGGQQ